MSKYFNRVARFSSRIETFHFACFFFFFFHFAFSDLVLDKILQKWRLSGGCDSFCPTY